MGNWLVKTFIKDYENVQDESVRFHYGILTTVVGIICNIILCLIKIISGWIIHSVSIVSDGFNNLSDSLSCIITLIGYKVANKPADKEHPFGHGRMEYIVSFISTVIIFIVIYQLFVDSVTKILHPEKIEFNDVLFVILIASISIKIWMAKFNDDLGHKLNNLVMKTTAQDARNDVFTTILSIVAMVLSCVYPDIPFDGIGGLILSIFLFYSAYQMAKEIVGALLGKSIDYSLVENVKNDILKEDNVLGVHDILIHEYGPNTHFGVAHMEVPSDMSLKQAHELADHLERHVGNKYHMNLTIHVDPVDKETEKYEECKKVVEDTLHSLNKDIEIHDFRTMKGNEHINVIFDCVVPFEDKIEYKDIDEAIYKAFEGKEYDIHLHANYEHGYVGDKEDDEEV